MGKESVKTNTEKLTTEKPVAPVTPVTEAKKPEKKPEENPQKYTLEALRANSTKLFGISASAFVGVSYGLEGEYTISEMKEKIDEWNKKEAK